MPRGGIRPSKDGSLDHLLQPKWKSGKTQTIRVPIVLSQDILDYARQLDAGNPAKALDLTQDNTDEFDLTQDNINELECLKEELQLLRRERDKLDEECGKIHAKHGDALNEIELLKEQLASKLSEPIAKPDLPDLNKVREQVLKKWRVIQAGESKDRIGQALDAFIKILES